MNIARFINGCCKSSGNSRYARGAKWKSRSAINSWRCLVKRGVSVCINWDILLFVYMTAHGEGAIEQGGGRSPALSAVAYMARDLVAEHLSLHAIS